VRDWVLRFSAEGADGLVNRKAPGKPPLLSESQRRELAAVIERGPIPAVDGVVRWRLIDLGRWVYETYGIAASKQALSRTLRAMGYRKLSARPRHHAQDPVAVAVFKNVWPAPSASSFADLNLPVCINVSGLWARTLAKMEIRASRSS
jgi:transposase